MTVNTFRLKGIGEGYTYSVYFEIKFDSDHMYVVSDNSGTRLSMNCKCTAAQVTSHIAESVFAGGQARLAGVSGRISFGDSKRTLLVPWASLPSTSDDIRLEIPIAPGDVAWIEDARKGSDLIGMCTLHGAASVKSGASVPVSFQTQNGQEVKMPWHQQEIVGVASENPEQIRIEREKWVKLLTQLGVGAHIVELPLIDLKKKKDEWKKVVERFDKANADFRGGDFEHCIGECRKVVEGVVTVLSSAWKVPPDPKHSFEQKVESMLARLRNKWPESSHSRLDALDKLINAIWDWSGPYHHFEGAVPHRQETSFVLHLTANLVELCAWILDNNPAEDSEGKH